MITRPRSILTIRGYFLHVCEPDLSFVRFDLESRLCSISAVIERAKSGRRELE